MNIGQLKWDKTEKNNKEIKPRNLIWNKNQAVSVFAPITLIPPAFKSKCNRKNFSKRLQERAYYCGKQNACCALCMMNNCTVCNSYNELRLRLAVHLPNPSRPHLPPEKD